MSTTQSRRAGGRSGRLIGSKGAKRVDASPANERGQKPMDNPATSGDVPPPGSTTKGLRLDPVDALALGLVVLITAGTLAMIAAGWADLRYGDSPGRYLKTICYPLTGEGLAQRLLGGVWPPGPFCAGRIISEVFSAVGLPVKYRAEQMLAVSAILGGLCLWLIYRIGRRSLGSRAGLIALLAAACLPIFHTLASTALGQIYALPLMLLGVLGIQRSLEDNRAPVAAGLWMLLASYCRSEAIIIAAALALALLWQRRWWHTLLFSALAGTYFVAQQVYLWWNNSMSYFNLSTFYDRTMMTMADKTRFLGLQMVELFQIPSRIEVGRTLALTLLGLLLAGLIISAFWLLRRRAGRPLWLVAAAMLPGILFLNYTMPNWGTFQSRDYGIGATLAVACLGMVLGLAWDAVARRHRRLGLATGSLLVVALAALAATGQIASTGWRRLEPQFLAARDWLVNHRQPGEGVLCDFQTRGIYLRASVTTPDDIDSCWSYAGAGLPYFESSVVRRPPADPFEERSFSAVDFLLQQQPRYVVTREPSSYAQLRDWDETIRPRHFRRPSFVLDYFVEDGPGRLRLDAPELIDGTVRLVERWQQSNVIIYETEGFRLGATDRAEEPSGDPAAQQTADGRNARTPSITPR